MSQSNAMIILISCFMLTFFLTMNTVYVAICALSQSSFSAARHDLSLQVQ